MDLGTDDEVIASETSESDSPTPNVNETPSAEPESVPEAVDSVPEVPITFIDRSTGETLDQREALRLGQTDYIETSVPAGYQAPDYSQPDPEVVPEEG